ncbi:MAG: galactokinase [Bacteroidota bacterium]
MTELQEKVFLTFKEHFQTEPVLYRAPGRINLIGEHTDYNDGWVFPAAVDKEMVFAIRLLDSPEKNCSLVAVDLGETFSFSLEDVRKTDVKSWANFLMGVVDQFHRLGHEVPAFQCAFGGDIPLGAGLSSSAALEAGFAFALNHLMDWKLSRLDLALLSQRVENEFVGLQCGIMDPYASLFGEAQHAMMLDCRSLKHELVPINLEGYTLLLCDSKVKHSLASSEYNTRRLECEEGVRQIKAKYPEVNSLRDVEFDMLKEFEDEMNAIVFNRCLYVVLENLRVQAASEAIALGDIISLGDLLYQSHSGLQHLYEVSCPEIDFLVESTVEDLSVMGARMMGGGFGGCTLNLLESSGAEAFKVRMKKAYMDKYGVELPIYEVALSQGVGPLERELS